MNPLLQAIMAFIRDGRHVVEIRLGGADADRRQVEFVFQTGASEEREYDCDRSKFVGWWHEVRDVVGMTTANLRAMTEAIQRAGEQL